MWAGLDFCPLGLSGRICGSPADPIFRKGDQRSREKGQLGQIGSQTRSGFVVRGPATGRDRVF